MMRLWCGGRARGGNVRGLAARRIWPCVAHGTPTAFRLRSALARVPTAKQNRDVSAAYAIQRRNIRQRVPWRLAGLQRADGADFIPLPRRQLTPDVLRWPHVRSPVPEGSTGCAMCRARAFARQLNSPLDYYRG